MNNTLSPACFKHPNLKQGRRLLCCVFLFIGAFHALAFGQEGAWFSFNDEWPLDKRVSRHEAEMLMLAEARKSVVELAAGIEVNSLEHVRKFEVLSTNEPSNNMWIEAYLNQSIQESNGKIAEEKPPVFKMTERDGLTYLSLAYQAKVVKEKGALEPGFAGTFDMNKPAYKEGDTLIFRMECTRNSWLYVFNVSKEGNFSLLFPNEFDREFPMLAFQPLQLPVKSNRYAFIAEITPSENRPSAVKKPQTEIIYALFFKGAEPLFTYSDAMKTEWSFVEFNQLLLQIPRNMRDSKLLSYTVYP